MSGDRDFILLADYFMGRDRTHAADLSDAIRANAAETVRRVNLLLQAAAADGVEATLDAVTRSMVASGWRPRAVNAATANAAANSRHQSGEACDIRDNRNSRTLARWALSLRGREALSRIGLWCERPQWTPDWLHCQIHPPRSGSRFFVPSAAPALVAALPGEVAATTVPETADALR